jgi:hypothetical protein
MSHEEWVVGYDARWALTPETPDQMDRKASEDSSIWPSVFNNGHYPGMSLTERERIGFGILPLPAYVGINHYLWERLDKLEEYLAGHRKAITKPYWIVAITGLVEEVARKNDPDEWPRFGPATPPSISREWELVGYDVNSRHSEDAVSWMITTVGVQDATVARLVGRLNVYGVFPNLEDAIEFRDHEDSEWPADAPHVVYGLWKMCEVQV